jgi:hypothetical protein
MLKHLWNKFKTFWFSFADMQESNYYFYLKDGNFRSSKVDSSLTRQEIQQIQSLVRRQIKDSESDIKAWKNRRNNEWAKSDPNVPESLANFEALNYWNDMVRYEKATLRKLVNLQTHLKRLKGLQGIKVTADKGPEA